MNTVDKKTHDKWKFDNSVHKIQRICRILFVERRVPGRLYQSYFSILNRLGVRTVTVNWKNGYVIKGYTHCLSMFYEVWSKRDYDMPGFQLANDMTVIDIGANQGFFSLYAASQGANVYAFEPCAENFAIFKWNVAKNGLGHRVQIFNEAVTGKKGPVNLFIGLSAAGELLSGSVSTIDSNRGGVSVRQQSVQSTTLDSILDDLHIEKCDFLKMDCEGAEYEILSNTSQRSFNKIARISMEFHNSRWQEAINTLRNAGFQITHVQPGEAGLIKARNLTLASPCAA